MRARFAGLPLALVLAAFVLSAAVHAHLPAQFPIHWDLHGQPNGHGGREFAWLVPLLMLMLNLVLSALPQGLEASGHVARRVQVMVMLFMLAVHAFVLLSALHLLGTSARTYVFVAVGLLFAGMGNYLGKVQRNFVLGIRTPWTLADDEVWLRTHRLGGKLMVVAGLLTVALAFVPEAPVAASMALLGAAGLVPCLYSYLLYRQLRRTGSREG